MNNIEKNDIEQINLDTLWMQKLNDAGVDLKTIDPFREITEQDIEYLKNIYPYVRIMNPNAINISTKNLKKTEATTGWQIFDYGNFIAISPGKKLYQSQGNQEFIKSILMKTRPNKTEENSSDDDGDGGTIFLPEAGTILQQTIDTIAEIIQQGIDKKWPYFKIYDGTEKMKKLTWKKNKKQGWLVEGYNPTEQDEKLLEKLRSLDEDWQQIPTILQSL